MTYRSLTQPTKVAPPKRFAPRTTKPPAGYFKKEESHYTTFGGQEAMRYALDHFWDDVLERNVRLEAGIEDTDWWVQEVDRAWALSSESAERWAVTFHFAADARRRLAAEATYVEVDRETLEWQEKARGQDLPILLEDVDAD